MRAPSGMFSTRVNVLSVILDRDGDKLVVAAELTEDRGSLVRQWIRLT